LDINKFFHLVAKIEVCILAVGAGIAVVIGTIGIAVMMVVFALDHTFPNWHMTLKRVVTLVT
jgi:hypothetical protein